MHKLQVFSMIDTFVDRKQHISIILCKKIKFATTQWEINCKYGQFFVKMPII